MVFLLLMSIGRLSAQEYHSVKDITQLNVEMSQLAVSTKTICADFVQEKHLDFLDVIVESKGAFVFKEPKNIRWEYISPYKYLILMNEDKFSIVQEDHVQEFDTKSAEFFQTINDLIVHSVQVDILNDTHFNTKVSESSSCYKLVLVPKKKQVKVVLSSIEILVDKKTRTVNQLTMYENASDYTVIKFYNKKINEDVLDEVFTTH